MTGMDRELRLNSIDRYVKRSPQFVLEEHGHCEVPAGCGGVVLRWRNPATAVPVRLELWFNAPTRYAVRIDGVIPSSSRPLLPPGRHVLMMETQPEVGAPIRILFRATVESSPTAELLSRPGPEWRWTATEPPREAWEQSEFDDGEWPTMSAATAAGDEGDNYTVRRLLENGALMITAAGTGPIWIRALFDVPAAGDVP
jgi:hypothetical protein